MMGGLRVRAALEAGSTSAAGPAPAREPRPQPGPPASPAATSTDSPSVQSGGRGPGGQAVTGAAGSSGGSGVLPPRCSGTRSRRSRCFRQSEAPSCFQMRRGGGGAGASGLLGSEGRCGNAVPDLSPSCRRRVRLSAALCLANPNRLPFKNHIHLVRSQFPRLKVRVGPGGLSSPQTGVGLLAALHVVATGQAPGREPPLGSRPGLQPLSACPAQRPLVAADLFCGSSQRGALREEKQLPSLL